MATLRMAKLWKDPRTGIWTLRRRIPARYRAVADQKGDTVKISTGTADPKEADKRFHEVLARWSAMVAEWERRLVGQTPAVDAPALSDRQLYALAGLWYRHKVHDFEAHPAAAALWDGWEDTMPADPYPEDVSAEEVVEGRAVVRPEYRRQEAEFLAPFRGFADDLLASAHVVTDDGSRYRLARLLVRHLAQALALHRRRVGGDYSPDPLRPTLPDWVAPTAPIEVPQASPPVSIRALFEAWKAVAVVKPRVVEETRYVVEALILFTGHDDAALITRDDLIRWRQAMKAEGRNNNTWNNRLSMIRQVFAHGVAEHRLIADPTDGLRLRKSRQQSPLPYSDADAVAILTAARRETRPSLRWAHWIMAFTGMRAGEVLQLLGRDVREDGGVWVFDINEIGEGKSVKTGQRRHVPLHPALLQEGFLAYAQAVAPTAPLFPDKPLDRFGNRGGRAWNVIGKWARETVGITDRMKAPDHSWRHRIEDEMRAAEVPEYARDAILGHARKTTGRQYGVRGEALATLHRYLSTIPVPPGVFPATVSQQAA